MHPMTYNQHFQEARRLLDRAADLNQSGGVTDRERAQLHVSRAHVHAVIGASLLAAAAAGIRNTEVDMRLVDIPRGAL